MNLTLGGGVCLVNSTISNVLYAILFIFLQGTHKASGCDITSLLNFIQVIGYFL